MFQRTKIGSGLLMAFGGTHRFGKSNGSAQRGTLQRVLRLSAPAITGAMFCVPVFAQDAAPTDSTAPQRVVITGSLIARTSAETAEAITIISADSLKNMGITTVEGAMAQIVSNNSTVTTATAVGSFSGGASFASLRGLGASKTLVLVDGQRLANNVVYGSAVDLNGIPFSAIDHIEVLREGASAAYGSDAIAGVINFITKKDLQGGEINVQGSHPQQHGGADSDVDATYGKGNLSTDGYNILAAVNYSHTKELRGYERAFASGFNPAEGLHNTNSPGTFPGGYTDANGNFYQVNAAGCPGNPFPTTANGKCDYLYSDAVDLIPDSSKASGFLKLSKAFGQDHTLSFQYLFTRSKVTSWGGPMEYFYTMTPQDDPTYYPTAGNSTYVPGESSAGATATPPAPNLTGPITVSWTDPTNNRYNYDINTEQRALLNFSGTDRGWDYTTNANFSINHNTQGVKGGYPVLSLLENANGNLNDAINPFGPESAAGQELLDSSYRSGDLASGQLSLWNVNAQGSHDVGDFFHAGHEAALALGVDIRGERISFKPTALATTLYQTTYYPPTTIEGSRTEQAVYGELNVPIIKQLDVTVSDREDHFSDFGYTNNGKLALRFQPSKLVTFRATASTGFRAPSLVDLYSPQVFGASSLMQGPGCAAGQYNAIFTAANCIAQGMALTGGNPDLKPERSDNFDLGIVLAPLPQWGITVDWYRVVIKNEIQSISATTIYDNYATLGGLYHLNNAGTLSTSTSAAVSCANGPSTPTCGYIQQTTTNTGGVTTNGIDLSSNYTLRSSNGTFKFGLEGTWVTAFLVQDYAGAPWLSTRGRWNQGNNPSMTWQHLLTMDWSKGAWAAGLSEKFTSSYVDEFTDASNNPRRVGASSIWNTYGSFKPIPSVTLLVGVRNLFNTNPSFSNQTASNFQGGYNINLSDPTGRAYYAKATYDF